MRITVWYQSIPAFTYEAIIKTCERDDIQSWQWAPTGCSTLVISFAMPTAEGSVSRKSTFRNFSCKHMSKQEVIWSSHLVNKQWRDIFGRFVSSLSFFHRFICLGAGRAGFGVDGYSEFSSKCMADIWIWQTRIKCCVTNKTSLASLRSL